MNLKKTVIATATALLFVFGAAAQKIERAEPPNWWTGMNTPLQIMFYGEGLGRFDVRIAEKGLKVKKVHKAESPNYLFVDVEFARNAKPGTYTFEFSDGKEKFGHTYEIGARREGSRERESFSSRDFVYLIMPDRFANGDPSNDETEDTVEGIDRANFHGRHGGDIQGVIDHLGYMASLGVTALWSTPFTLDDEPTYSYHGYACADYYGTDPRFGSNELYREMVRQAHTHGIKIIMDVVTNHCGTAHWWMKDLPFGDWIHRFPEYTRSSTAMAGAVAPNASEYDRKLFFEGWFDRSMPDMNMKNPYVFNYFRQWAVWWIENMDIDGLRVDTYPFNDKPEMAGWVQSVLDEYPNLSIVGECWHTSSSQTAYWMGGQDNRDGFDSHLPMVMDFPFMFAVNNALQSDVPVWEKGTMEIYNVIAQDFLYPDSDRLMIFLDNHDTEHLADAMDGNTDKIKMALTLLATVRGMPQMWVGTELMFRSSDLGEGHGSARIDFPGAWPGDKRNLFRETDRTKEEQEVFSHTQKLFNWRRNKPVIHTGRTVQFHNHDNSYVFFRRNDEETVMVVINNSAKPKKIDWPVYAEMTGGIASGYDIISGQRIPTAEEYHVAPYASAVIEFRNK